jgi:hypothetical protein
MDLQIAIKIYDELDDDVIESQGMLDMASGEIRDVRYVEHDVDAQGFPAESADYDFTMGQLSNGRQEVEFSIQADVLNRRYSVTPSELLELKGRAAKLFAGLTDGQPTVEPIKPKRSR